MIRDKTDPKPIVRTPHLSMGRKLTEEDV